MSLQPEDIRPEVMAFAEEMELKLRRNDTKGGWKTIPQSHLAMGVVRETCELLASLRISPTDMEKLFEKAVSTLDAHDYSSDPKPEAVDIANFSMMIFDNFTNGRY